jgi:hypothetical protein
VRSWKGGTRERILLGKKVRASKGTLVCADIEKQTVQIQEPELLTPPRPPLTNTNKNSGERRIELLYKNEETKPKLPKPRIHGPVGQGKVREQTKLSGLLYLRQEI